MLLTKHEGVTFQDQTVYISGQAFVRCTFDRCNWHVDRVLLWGSPESVQEVKALVNMIEAVQQQAAAAQAASSGAVAAQSPVLAADSTDVPPLTT